MTRFLRFGVLAAMLAHVAGFGVSPARLPASARSAPLTMGLFDGLAGAFANDDTLGAQKSAGLSKAAQKVTVTWVNPKTGAKKTALCVPGQALKDVARGAGIKIQYDCNEGTCKTCTSSIGKICVMKVPKKDVTIKYNIKM